MHLNFKYLKYTFNLNISKPLNAVIGDSSTGKSALVDYYRKSKEVDTDFTAIYTEVLPEFFSMVPANSLFLLDTDTFDSPYLIDFLVRNSRDDIYVILLGRRWLERFPLDIANVFKLITVKGVTKNIPFVEKELVNITSFNKVLC